jgi:type IV pilus assembly protein PilA
MSGLLKRLTANKKALVSKFRREQRGFSFIEILVVVAITGVIASIAIPNIAGFADAGEQESENAEATSIQTAVLAMMSEAKMDCLNDSYTEVDTAEEIGTVTAGEEVLTDYLLGMPHPLKQPYDISQEGEVTVSGGDDGGDGDGGGETIPPVKEDPLPIKPPFKPGNPFIPFW